MLERSLSALSIPLLIAAASAQTNLVSNGDFGKGLTGWAATGKGTAPQVESADVHGLGASSSSFGVNPGPGQLPIQQPPYVLSQSVLSVAGIPYEVYLDVLCTTASFNADGGTVWVKMGGTEVARVAYGQVAANAKLREVICARFAPKTSGSVKLEVGFHRRFLSLRGRTPRINVDNISLQFAPGPVFCVRGSRRPADTVRTEVTGNANALFAVFVAAKATRGVNLPPFKGTWYLDPATTAQFNSGSLNGNGRFTSSFFFPNNPSLAGQSLWFQPVTATGNAIDLGLHHDFGVQR